jgi:hypothetical protein
MASLLTPTELAERWQVSPRTLERWRWLRTGPSFLKIGTAVRYRLEDVEAFEAAQLCQIKQDRLLGRWR